MQGPIRADRAAETLAEQLPLIEQVIAFVCVRWHVSATEADEFGAEVRLRLVDNNYAVLTKFQGRSSLRTYLTTVIQRLFLDFRIRAWGKWRPSAQAKRLGPTALLLEKVLTKDHYSFEEACEVLQTNHRVPETRAQLEALAESLPCRGELRRFESDEVLADVPSAFESPEAAMGAVQTAKALQAVLMTLSPQDQLILVMRFVDGRTIADIARELVLDQQGLYRRIDHLLKKLRTSLEAAGIDSIAAAKMLESPAISFEW
jgi:RNA polymerase sigma factor (sigma-70 family)